MRFRIPHHITDRKPRPDKKPRYPKLLTLHRAMGKDIVSEMTRLEKIVRDKAVTLPRMAGVMRRMDELKARYGFK